MYNNLHIDNGTYQHRGEFLDETNSVGEKELLSILNLESTHKRGLSVKSK